jgi:ribokinase
LLYIIKNDLLMKHSIVVVGISNTDMVIKADRLSAAGETIIGGIFFMNPGGKGANQAVAAARLGGNVTFIAKTGNDIFGRQSLQIFEEKIKIMIASGSYACLYQ